MKKTLTRVCLVTAFLCSVLFGAHAGVPYVNWMTYSNGINALSNNMLVTINATSNSILSQTSTSSIPAGILTNNQTGVTLAGTFIGAQPTNANLSLWAGLGTSAPVAITAQSAKRASVTSSEAQSLVGLDGSYNFTVTSLTPGLISAQPTNANLSLWAGIGTNSPVGITAQSAKAASVTSSEAQSLVGLDGDYNFTVTSLTPGLLSAQPTNENLTGWAAFPTNILASLTNGGVTEARVGEIIAETNAPPAGMSNYWDASGTLIYSNLSTGSSHSLDTNMNSVTSGGYFYSPVNSAGVYTNLLQPMHAFAALMGYFTNTINGGTNTYAIVTNYSTARTNTMTCGLDTGCITNSLAGLYWCGIHMSMKSLDAGALIEGDLLLDGVERDEISFQTQFDPGTPRYKGVSAFGIIYIPANTQITFEVKSSGGSGIEIRRAQLVVMSP